jgi:hypothetical protein
MRVLALVLAAGLAACAELTAETPLFAPSDQHGPPPLTEGLWIAVHDECPDSNLRRRRFPSECMPMTLSRQTDGSWLATIRIDLMTDLTREERLDEETSPRGPYRIVLAPAVERVERDAYAPLYVGEMTQQSGEQPSGIGYVVVAPVGAMPATEARIIGSIGCDSILRDGPIDGITPNYRMRIDADGQEHRELSGCVAATPAAVREAARRSVIEHFGDLTQQRFVYVRAN